MSPTETRTGITVQGALVTISPMTPGYAYPLDFVCNSVNLPNGASQVDFCALVKAACVLQNTFILDESQDLCPLPFIDLTAPEVVDALRARTKPSLFVGGTDDEAWDGAVARELGEVLELEGADHGLARVADAPRIGAAVEAFSGLRGLRP